MALGRLHPSDEYDIRIAVEEGEGGSLDGKWIAMLVDEIEHYSGENTRLTALLAERDAEIARLVAERDAYRDSLLLISRGVWTARNSVESIVWGAREALKKGAALAARGGES